MLEIDTISEVPQGSRECSGSPGHSGGGETVRERATAISPLEGSNRTASSAQEGLGGIISERVGDNTLEVLLDAS